MSTVLPAAPREEGGPVEPVANVSVRQAELRKHLVLHLLLPGHGQRHIDAAERHPIDEGLPLRPVVPDERVRVRAHIPGRRTSRTREIKENAFEKSKKK